MNTQYRIKNHQNDPSLTSISKIGLVKREGDEWIRLSKKFVLSALPDFAAIRFSSVGVSAVYINGELLAADTGRYANRISYAELTSKLKCGENEISVLIGGHYYQPPSENIVARRGSRFSCVAGELELYFGDIRETVVTGDDWVCESDLGVCTPEVFTNIPQAEYERFWLSAALCREDIDISAPDEILAVAKGYGAYIAEKFPKFICPSSIFETNMESKGGSLVATKPSSFVTYEFDRLYCGYTTVEYIAESDCTLELRFDYTGYPEDIDFTSQYANICAKRLTVKRQLKAGRNTLTLVRRRAPRFMRLEVPEGVEILSVGLIPDMMNPERLGYFNCSDSVLNNMWEVGKYTLHITKHQEYESCPKNEMKYFTGDGIISALIDAYAFGEGDLTVSSFSFTEMTSNTGLIYDRFLKNVGLWEYPAWRIVQGYNHYRFFKDEHFVNEHFDELAGNIDWMIGKMGATNLIYQFPIFSGAFAFDTSSTDYTQSPDRLGEKPLLNALFYKSLIAMAELAEIVGDGRADFWRALAEKVKVAINARLWSDEAQAYLDTFNDSYIPQDGNALCLLFGIAEGERADAVMKTLRNSLWTSCGSAVRSEPDAHTYSGNDVISPPMNTHEAEARFLLGDEEGALELMRLCWGSMLSRGATTFWEYSDVSDSPERKKYFTACHAWSAGCTYLLSAYVLGVRPASAGYESLIFAPCSLVDDFSGVVPTPKGLVAVRCESEDGKKKYTVALPRDISLEAKLPEGAALEVVEY